MGKRRSIFGAPKFSIFSGPRSDGLICTSHNSPRPVRSCPIVLPSFTILHVLLYVLHAILGHLGKVFLRDSEAVRRSWWQQLQQRCFHFCSFKVPSLFGVESGSGTCSAWVLPSMVLLCFALQYLLRHSPNSESHTNITAMCDASVN